MDDYHDYMNTELFDILLHHFQDLQEDLHKLSKWGWPDRKFQRSNLRWPIRIALGGIEYNCNLLQDMKCLQEESTLSDVTIKVDGKVFQGHRLILAAASQYFEDLFTSGLKGSKTKTIQLKDMESDVFEELLEFIYTGKLALRPETAVFSIHAAAFLGLRNAENILIEYFNKSYEDDSLGPPHSLPVWDAAKTHGMDKLATEMFPRMMCSLRYIINTDLFLEKVPAEAIGRYARHSNDEPELLSRIIQWLKYDFEKRKDDAYELLQGFHLGLMQKNKVRELMDAQILEIPECKKMMDDLNKKWNEFEGVEDVMKLPESLLPKGMTRTLVAFGGKEVMVNFLDSLFPSRDDDDSDEDEEEDYDSDDSVDHKYTEFGYYFNKTTKEWTRLKLHCPELPPKFWKLYNPSMVVANRDIYLAGGLGNSSTVSETLSNSKRFYKLDGGSYKWTELPPMKHARSRFALVHHDGFLYAIGGMQEKRDSNNETVETRYLNSVERFNLAEQKWDRTYKLPAPLAYASAVVFKGKILVYCLKDHPVGGSFNREREFWLVGFDPATQKWSKILQESYAADEDALESRPILAVHDGACYRVKYEGVPDAECQWLTKCVTSVNRVIIKTRNGSFGASIGSEVKDQDILPDNKAGAFHIDGHIYVNVCGFAHKTGAVQGDPNSDVATLNGWSKCESLKRKCVVEYAFGTSKM